LFENYNISISSVEPVPSEVFHLIAKIGLYPCFVWKLEIATVLVIYDPVNMTPS